MPLDFQASCPIVWIYIPFALISKDQIDMSHGSLNPFIFLIVEWNNPIRDNRSNDSDRKNRQWTKKALTYEYFGYHKPTVLVVTFLIYLYYFKTMKFWRINGRTFMVHFVPKSEWNEFPPFCSTTGIYSRGAHLRAHQTTTTKSFVSSIWGRLHEPKENYAGRMHYLLSDVSPQPNCLFIDIFYLDHPQKYLTFEPKGGIWPCLHLVE